MAYKWTVSVLIPKDDATGLSAAQDFGGGATHMGVIMPAAWNAADLSFQVSTSGDGTFYDLFGEAGAEVKPASTPAQGKVYALNTMVGNISPFRWVKVRSGLTGAAVTQTTASTYLTFVFQR